MNNASVFVFTIRLHTTKSFRIPPSENASLSLGCYPEDFQEGQGCYLDTEYHGWDELMITKTGSCLNAQI